MSEGFIRTWTGALNLRHVRRIREQKDGKDRSSYTAVMDDDREYDVDLGSEALDSLSQRLVPAGPEDRACLLSVNPDDLTAEAVWEQHVKIVAWGISTNYAGGLYGATPIFTDSLSSNQTPLIRCPDGSWLIQEDTQYATLEEAKRDVLQQHFEREEARRRLAETEKPKAAGS